MLQRAERRDNGEQGREKEEKKETKGQFSIYYTFSMKVAKLLDRERVCLLCMADRGAEEEDEGQRMILKGSIVGSACFLSRLSLSCSPPLGNNKASQSYIYLYTLACVIMIMQAVL